MGCLAGFSCRRVARRLKTLGFTFDRQAAGSHEIWFNAKRHTPTIPVIFLKVRYGPSSDRQEFHLSSF